MDIDPDKIVCKKNSSVHFRAQEVLKSIERRELPGTPNRDGSVEHSYDIIPIPYLTSDVVWGAFDSAKMGPKFGFQYKEGLALTLDPQFIDYDTKEIKYTAGYDFAFGFNDLRNWVLSSGADA